MRFRDFLSFIQDKELPQPPDIALYELLEEQLKEILASLSAKERRVIKMRFVLVDGSNRTLEEVGEEFRITREGVRQIGKKALTKL